MMDGVLNKLIYIVDTYLGVPSVYSDWNRFSIDIKKFTRSDSDKKNIDPKFQLPVIHIVIPAQGTINTKFDVYKDYPTLYINFMIEHKEKGDFDPLSNDSKIEAMKNLAYKFIYYFNKSGLFEPLPDDIEYRPLYMVTHESLTGVSLTIKAKEIDGLCLINGFPGYKPEIPDIDEIDPGIYYTLTAADTNDIKMGYYSIYDGSFIESHNYRTYALNILLDRGNMFKFTGFIDTEMRFTLGNNVDLDASVFNPIRILRYTLPTGTTSIIVTTRADVPFNVKIGTIE